LPNGGKVLNLFNETVHSGVKPLELIYQSVINTEFSKPMAYRSILQINSLDLGVLTPDQYMAVASRTNQCVELAVYNLENLCEDIVMLEKKNLTFDWLSAFIPVRMLLKTDISKSLEKIMQDYGLADCSKICFEFPVELLYESREEVNTALKPLKELGIHLLLRDFADEFCPVLRLKDLIVDTVIISGDENNFLNLKEDKSMRSIVNFIKEQGFEIIVDGVENKEQLSYVYYLNCIAAVGKISGKHKRIATIIKNR